MSAFVPIVGIFAPRKKLNNSVTQQLIATLTQSSKLRLITCAWDTLPADIAHWPRVDVLLAYALDTLKCDALKCYRAAFNVKMINEITQVHSALADRVHLRSLLLHNNIAVPNGFCIDFKEASDIRKVSENGETLRFGDVTLRKPFVEKPRAADDHAVRIYWPNNGGCRELFRKSADKANRELPQVNAVRRDACYVYEEYVDTDACDIKVYTLGSDECYAERRVAASCDAPIVRDAVTGKQVRQPVQLTRQERQMASDIVRVFKHDLCGFDVLRCATTGRSLVCDVNGYSHVYADAYFARVRALVERRCASLHWLSDEVLYECVFEHLSELRDLTALQATCRRFAALLTVADCWRRAALALQPDTRLEYSSSWKATAFARAASCRQRAPLQLRGTERAWPGVPSAYIAARLWRNTVNVRAFTALRAAADIARFDNEAALRWCVAQRLPAMWFGATRGWPANEAWQVDKLVAAHGDVQFKVSHEGDEVISMRFADYIGYAQQQCDETPLYVFDRKFDRRAPLLGEQYTAPAFVKAMDVLQTLDERVRPTLRWMVIGPARSGASWHRDPLATSAWNALLCGRKRWAMYPPHKVPPAVHAEYDEHDKTKVVDWGTYSSVRWFAQVYPHLSDDEKPYIECIQQPGEMIYVPAHWWHCVLNLDLTVAVTENFGQPQNVAQVYDEIVGRGKGEQPVAAKSAAEAQEMKEYQAALDQWKNQLNFSSQNVDDGSNKNDTDRPLAMLQQRALELVGASASQAIRFEHGEHAVFNVDNAVVVKFCTVDGARNELAALQMLQGESFVPIVVDSGAADGVVMTEFLSGCVPMRDVAEEMTLLQCASLSLWCAQTLRRVHERTRAVRGVNEFREFLRKAQAGAAQRHREWCSLPVRLVFQVDEYLSQHLCVEWGESTVLLHGDINDENVLLDADTRLARALIDFGDCLRGDAYYELVALFVSVLQCDKAAIASFWAAYAAAGEPLDCQRLLALTLVHPVDVLATAFAHNPAALSAASLQSLAEQLFDLNDD